MHIGYVIPTRDRPAELARTLAALGSLPGARAGDHVVIADNASVSPVRAPARLANGIGVRVIRLGENAGAAARNTAAAASDAEWVVMLDDDSAPIGAAPHAVLERQPADVAAVMADIFLPSAGDGVPRRESGGLPEVPVGCGVALRRGVFVGLGGYDAAFGYYAEEYDLAARLLLAGMRVAFEPGFCVLHRKVSAARDMNVILGRLVRNNGWVAARYAPDDEVDARLAEVRDRYAAIARKENATEGYAAGLAELERTLAAQRRTPMPRGLWDRFTGLSAARGAVRAEAARRGISSAALVLRGKHDWAVAQALREAGVEPTRGVPGPCDTLVVATLSPGPMRDGVSLLGATGRRVLAPWTEGGPGARVGAGAGAGVG